MKKLTRLLSLLLALVLCLSACCAGIADEEPWDDGKPPA